MQTLQNVNRLLFAGRCDVGLVSVVCSQFSGRITHHREDFASTSFFKWRVSQPVKKEYSICPLSSRQTINELIYKIFFSSLLNLFIELVMLQIWWHQNIERIRSKTRIRQIDRMFLLPAIKVILHTLLCMLFIKTSERWT